MGHCATSAKLVHHGGMMHCGGGVKEGRIGAGGDNSYSVRTLTSINDGGCRHPMAAMDPTPGFYAFGNQKTNYVTGLQLHC